MPLSSLMHSSGTVTTFLRSGQFSITTIAVTIFVSEAGEEKARVIARETIARVRKAIGVDELK